MDTRIRGYIYYVVTDERGGRTAYQVPLRVRVVAHALLRAWMDRMVARGHYHVGWSVHQEPAAGITAVICWECPICGGLETHSGGAPLECGCRYGDWAKLPELLEAVMDFRGHDSISVAECIPGASPGHVEQWLHGCNVPAEGHVASLRDYLHGAIAPSSSGPTIAGLMR